MCVQVCLSRLLDFEWISEQEPPTITVLRTQQQPRACKAKRNLNVRSKICKIFRNMSAILSNDARATPLTITSRKPWLSLSYDATTNWISLILWKRWSQMHEACRRALYCTSSLLGNLRIAATKTSILLCRCTWVRFWNDACQTGPRAWGDPSNVLRSGVVAPAFCIVILTKN